MVSVINWLISFTLYRRFVFLCVDHSLVLLISIRAMKLDQNQAQRLLEEYTGPRYEVEKQMMVFHFFRRF